jgi:hypothetical protein
MFINIQPLDHLPLWGILILNLVIFMLSIEAGYRLENFLQKRFPDQALVSVGTMVGASLAFLGFFLALITSTAVGIFNERRTLVISEANAIGTTYLRAEYLEEPFSSESRRLLSEYVDVRLSARNPDNLAAALDRTKEIHQELWSLAVDAAQSNPTPVTSLYIASLNEVIDLHTLRVNANLVYRVPPWILLGIYFVAIMCLVLIGVQSSYVGNRNVLSLVLMVLILSMVFYLISDLERNQAGLIRISSQALLDLQQQLRPGP